MKLQCARDHWQTKLCAPEAKKRHAHRTGAEEPIHGSGMAPRFGILAAAGRGTGSGWRKTPKAIKETGRSQDPHRQHRRHSRQGGWTEGVVANRGRLASRKLTARARSLPPLAATCSCSWHLPLPACPCSAPASPASSAPRRALLGPWRRREATPAGAERP